MITFANIDAIKKIFWDTACKLCANIDSAAHNHLVLGLMYEHVLCIFANAEGKRDGQFYNPDSIVKTLAAMLNPYQGLLSCAEF